MGNKKTSTELIRQDLLIDVEYRERTIREVYIWMMLLTLDYLKIINNKGKVDLYYEMCYCRQLHRGIDE